MPYKSEKINIAGSEHDRRCKLTNAQRDEIISLRGIVSQRKWAETMREHRHYKQELYVCGTIY